jgi:hypothetical protein
MLSPHGGQHSSEGRLSGTEPRPMSAGELCDMWSGETCLVFYGFVDYLDSVGTSHTTRFCSYWDHNFAFSPVGPPDSRSKTLTNLLERTLRCAAH